MLRRKVVALCLILVFALGTGSAFAATVETPAPSQTLLALAARANQLIDQTVARTQEAADRVVAAYNAGNISYAAADASLRVMCVTLRTVTDAFLIPVIVQARREGITWDCVYEEVQIGWRTTWVDPILVPGNAE